MSVEETQKEGSPKGLILLGLVIGACVGFFAGYMILYQPLQYDYQDLEGQNTILSGDVRHLENEMELLSEKYSERVEEYEDLLRDYNVLVEDYDDLLDDCNSLINKYNALVGKVNRARETYNSYIRKINNEINDLNDLLEDPPTDPVSLILWAYDVIDTYREITGLYQEAFKSMGNVLW